jgi:hypothetical protein
MYTGSADERTVGSSNSLPAPAMPFPASLPAPAGPFSVSMPGGVRLPPLGKAVDDPTDQE